MDVQDTKQFLNDIKSSYIWFYVTPLHRTLSIEQVDQFRRGMKSRKGNREGVRRFLDKLRQEVSKIENSHPEGELDSVGVTTYEGLNKVQKLNQELECYINLFLNLNLINSDKIKEMTR